MKKLITLLLFVLFASVSTYSQTATRKYEYALVRFDFANFECLIYYGTNGNKVKENFAELKNIKIDKKKLIEYLPDVLNYMDERGYEFVSAYNENVAGSTYGDQYIFRREIKK